MHILNVEIKARCAHPEEAEYILMQEQADFIGLDHQIDTYFRVPEGRMKLREGNIEHSLIYYRRENQEGPKTSDVILHKPSKDPGLKDLLTHSLGILTVVDKKRKIFFIGNVKFHLDEVIGLGSFVEIEAIDKEGNIGREALQKQCDHYLQLLGIKTGDLVAVSYSDLLLEGKQ